MNDASSEHSQTTAAATSSGVPTRVIACGAMISRWRSGVWFDISGGHDRGRTHRVDADAVVGVLDGRVLGQPHYAVLARRVGAEPDHGTQAGIGRGVHDRAAAVGEHLADLMLHAQECAAEVHRDCRVEVLVGRLVKQLVNADAGVVVREVEPPETLDDTLDERLVVARARDVAGGELRSPAQLLDRRHRLLRPGARTLQVGDDHRRPLRREANGACPPDAAGSAGHQPRPAGQQAAHARRLCIRRSAPTEPVASGCSPPDAAETARASASRRTSLGVIS
jgi:hypothetical protein